MYRPESIPFILFLIRIVYMGISDNHITKSHLSPVISSTDHSFNQEHSPEYISKQYMFCLTDVGLIFFFFFLFTFVFEEKLEGYLSKNKLKTSDIMIIHENMFYHLEVQWKMHDGIKGSDLLFPCFSLSYVKC